MAKCKKCGLPEFLCACDGLGFNDKRTNTKCVIFVRDNGGMTSTKHKKQVTVLRGIKQPNGKVLKKLRSRFNTHVECKGGEIRLNGNFEAKLRNLVHTSPLLFLFLIIMYRY